MKIGQYCQRQRCRHVELEQFWQAFASRGFVNDSWAFLFSNETVCAYVAVPLVSLFYQTVVDVVYTFSRKVQEHRFLASWIGDVHRRH